MLNEQAEKALKRIEELGGSYVWERELCVALLSRTGIQDNDVRVLLDIPQVEIVSLKNTAVTDAVFDYLIQLPNLEGIDLINTRVTQAGVENFRAARPTVRITTEPVKGVNPFTGEPL